jgi:cytochrome bd ubiquinol oxidase subunit I
LGYMMRLVRKGPVTHESTEPTHGGPGQKRTPARPLSAADDGNDDDHVDIQHKGH